MSTLNRVVGSTKCRYSREVQSLMPKMKSAMYTSLPCTHQPTYAFARYTCKEIGALKFVMREVLDDASRTVEM
jgi:hypothetical protein